MNIVKPPVMPPTAAITPSSCPLTSIVVVIVCERFLTGADAFSAMQDRARCVVDELLLISEQNVLHARQPPEHVVAHRGPGPACSNGYRSPRLANAAKASGGYDKA
jgi:hypothetical protein